MRVPIIFLVATNVVVSDCNQLSDITQLELRRTEVEHSNLVSAEKFEASSVVVIKMSLQP